MRICMLTTSYPRNESDQDGWFVAALARELARRPDTHVTVLAPGAGPESPPSENDGRLEVRRLRYFVPERWQRLAYGHGIPWNLRRSFIAWLNVPCLLVAFAVAIVRDGRAADVIHAHWGVLGALAVALRPVHGRPVVVTVHGSDLVTGIAPIRWLTCWAARWADALTTPSEQFRDRLRGIHRRDCHWVPNGTTLPDRAEVERRRAAVVAPGPRIVSVGRLIPERCHYVLVSAFARVRKEHPRACLTLVGDGPEHPALAAQASARGLAAAVDLPGKIAPESVPDYLLDADLYVSPTTVETFGLAVVEAAAYGLPVVTTSVGFPAQLVAEADGGIVVEPQNEAALAGAMLRMLADPDGLRARGRRMRDTVERMGLTWGEAARRFAAIYAALLV